MITLRRQKRPLAQSQRGLSLLESLVVVFIMAILLGMTGLSLKSTVRTEGPRAMAHNLVSDLRAARAEASRSGKMVAFCFPSDGKRNSFSRNAVVRKGAQRGHVQKILSYDRAYKGNIFVGEWPGSVLSSQRIPVGWSLATADELALFFRPDGTVYSNDIPAVEGNFPLIVGSKALASGGGPDGVLTHISDPHTIWVSQSGNVTLEERSLPDGSTLPPANSEPTVAQLDLSSEPPATNPKIEDILFLPEPNEELDTVGLGQNYVHIHADQKESERLEYGIATMLITATDADGGPLFFDLTATATEGDSGNFTVSNETGAMNYIYDQREDEGKWQALVSWRPPPGAEQDTEYELEVTVRDVDGNTETTSSGAGLLPRVATLPPTRMALETTNGEILLANAEAASTIKISIDGEPEYEPFFSPDGTRIYTKHKTPAGGLQLRVRNGDGTGLRILKEFSPAIVAANSNGGDINIKFDPTYSYAAYRFNVRPGHYPAFTPQRTGRRDEWRLVSTPGRIPTIYELEAIHLNSGSPPIQIATDAYGRFFWDGVEQHTLRFQSARPYEAPDDLVTPTAEQAADGVGPYIPAPGHEKLTTNGARLEGYPPRQEAPRNAVGIDATNQIFNLTNPIWFLETPGDPGIRLGQAGRGTGEVVSVPEVVGDPAWSADGLNVAYVVPSIGARTVMVKEVLNEDFTPKTPEEIYRYSDSNITSAKLSPKGRWVFFIKNGILYRARNSSGSSPVRIWKDLEKRIASFAVSQ